MILTICIATYKRPAKLRELLESIRKLRIPERVSGIRIAIVDNDQQGSAAALIREISPGFPFRIDYGIEQRRGIPFARNHALRLAQGSDFACIVDDDETVDPEWLAELLRVQAEGDHDLVTGPVFPRYESPPPAWVLKTGFFEKRGFPVGKGIRATGTNNMLIRLASVAGARPFNEAFGNNGGDDGHFIYEGVRNGLSIGWAASAKVFESIPPARMRPGFYLQRRFRVGVSLAQSDRIFGDRCWACKRFFRGTLKIVAGVVRMPAAIFRKKACFLRSVGDIWYGAGNIWALLGKSYQEYSKRKEP